MAAELQVLLGCRLPKDNGKFEGWYIFFPFLPKSEANIYIYPFKSCITWTHVCSVITKLQQNFVLGGFGDKASIRGNNLWSSTLNANKMKMQSLKKAEATMWKTVCTLVTTSATQSFCLALLVHSKVTSIHVKMNCVLSTVAQEGCPATGFPSTANNSELCMDPSNLLFLPCSKEACRCTLQFLSFPGKCYFL